MKANGSSSLIFIPMNQDTFMLYVPIRGTFSVSTDIENLNYAFLSKFLDTSKLIIMSPWDGAWEIEQIIRNGTLVGHKLFDVPGIIKNAQWSVAYDEENKRVFFYMCGGAAFNDLKTESDMKWAESDTQKVMHRWIRVISTLLHGHISGGLVVGDEVEWRFRDEDAGEYDSMAELMDGLTRYRFFPKGDYAGGNGAGATHAHMGVMKLWIEQFFAGKPVRYEVSHDRGITWEPYTPEE